MPLAWQKKRSAFNHDWLKNQFLPALASCHNGLKGHVEYPELESTLSEKVLPEWEAHRDEATTLVADLEAQMSPRILLDQFPLSLAGDDTKRWLSELVHELWLTRYSIRPWVAEACVRIAAADTAYQRLQTSLRAGKQGDQSILPVFEQFRRCCHELARAIEQFPSEVRAT